MTSEQIDLLNQRYNQYKVRFDEQKLPLRQGYNRRLAKMLLKHFPGLYRFRLLILISEIGEKLIMSELQLIYWYTIILEYLRQVKEREGERFLDFSQTNHVTGKPLWSEERMDQILTLAGIFVKKELIRLQSAYFVRYRSIIEELRAQSPFAQEQLTPKHKKSEEGTFNGIPKADDWESISTKPPKKPPQLQDGSLKSNIECVLAHNTHSLEDQTNELICIEQNLKSFHGFPNLKRMYYEFAKEFKFDMSNISLSQLNKEYHIIRKTIKPQQDTQGEPPAKRRKTTD